MDVAALALTVDSSSVVKATKELDRFSAASDRAAAAAGRPIGNTAKMAQDYARAADKAAQYSNAASRAAAANDNAAAAAQRMASANDNVGRALGAADAHVVAYTQHLAQMARAQQDANAHVFAYQQQLRAQASVQGDANAHVLAYRNSLKQVEDGANKVSTAIKFTARDGLSASRQLADVGVTALSGMNPFLIALQQGPQLFDILQEKAVATGATIGATFRAAGAAIWAALAPLLPIILPIVGAIALVTAGLAALTAQANNDSGLKKYTTAMGYTKAEVEKLNAVTVTMGDTAKAVFQVGWARIAEAFGISTSSIAKTWQSFLNWLVTATRATLAGIYAGILGIMDLRKNIVEDGMNGKLGLDTFTRGFKERYAQAQKFMDDVVKQAGKNARKRQDDMAAKFYDKPKGSGSGSKADPLGDILRGAEAEIKAEQARAAAAGLSARAAAELEQRTKLLNQIEKAKIPVTDALRDKVAGLAKSYADAKIAADVAVAIQSVTDAILKQIDAVNDETSLIGLYGDALIRARNEVEALRKAQEALPKGEALTPDQATAIAADAAKLSRDQILQNQLKRAEDLRKASEDAAYAMDLERKGLVLTGEAAIAYTFVTERLVKAKQDGIDLSAAEVAAIEAAGAAYARQRYSIDQTAQAIADAKEVAGEFFRDWFGKVREGENVFKSFADSVINALNRILDKLLDKALDAALNAAISGSFANGGSFGGAQRYASGGAFDQAQRFATGGAFTNRVVDSPTLFRFANGSKLGEMGEAGPEAIMPLKRGPNGSLGVEVHGGTRSKAPDVYIENTYQFDGAVGLDAIVAMIRRGGQATYDQVKRDLQAMLQQLDNDGATSS